MPHLAAGPSAGRFAAALDPGSAFNAPRAASWIELGPRPIIDKTQNELYFPGAPPYAGRVSAIAVDPTDAEVAYLGGAAGGVWKTTDGGNTWTPTFDSQPALAIGALAIDPQEHNTIWAGTGESNIADAYFGDGVYKSTNGGSTWSKIGGSTFDRCFTADAVVKPDDSNTVLIAVAGPRSSVHLL